jgi:hypothetical protein
MRPFRRGRKGNKVDRKKELLVPNVLYLSIFALQKKL